MNLFNEPDEPGAKKIKGGHAAPPAGGSEGETCKKCGNYYRVNYHDKYYRKCGLMQHAWTHGPGSDIKASDPACRLWEPIDLLEQK